MMKKTDLERAKNELNKGYTCVLIKNNSKHVSKRTGIAPMINFLEKGIDLSSFSVADKIVGKAVALLFVKAKIKEVYAEVISVEAIKILDLHNIKYSYKTKTENIINRTKTGICPMEQTVKDISDCETAYNALRKKLSELKNH